MTSLPTLFQKNSQLLHVIPACLFGLPPQINMGVILFFCVCGGGAFLLEYGKQVGWKRSSEQWVTTRPWISQSGCAFLSRQRNPVHSTHTDTLNAVYGSPAGAHCLCSQARKRPEAKRTSFSRTGITNAPYDWSDRAVNKCCAIWTQWEPSLIHYSLAVICKRLWLIWGLALWAHDKKLL